MVTIIATIKIKEGKMEEVIEYIKEIIPKVKNNEPGCLEYIPHTAKGSKHKNKISFYEKYKDKNALNEHLANLPKLFEKILPLVEGGIDDIRCNEII